MMVWRTCSEKHAMVKAKDHQWIVTMKLEVRPMIRIAWRKVAPDPGLPTQSEIDDHSADHWPYRSWCEFCVKGRATGEPHMPGPISSIPIIAFDYLFITRGKILRRDELSKEDQANIKMKILVVKDTKGKAVFAHTVRQKGVDEEGYAVARITEDVQWLGYTKLILKIDGERAIVRLLRGSLKVIKANIVDDEGQASFENPPTYDPRSNGAVENAVKMIKGMLRTCKLGLEARIGGIIPDDHPVMTWLVEHVAWILTVRPNGEDGKAPFQRVRGRPFAKKAVEFGERVLFKLPMDGPRHDERGVLQARWSRGIMLGYSRFSNEYRVWDGHRVIKARTIQRMKRDLRWHKEGLEKISMDVHGSQAVVERPDRFQELAEVPPPRAEEANRAPQNIAIRQADWIRHGSSQGCPKCTHADDHGWGHKSGPHSPACVERFKKLLTESEKGRRRIEEAETRQNQWMAKKVQEADEKPREAPNVIPQEFEPQPMGSPSVDEGATPVPDRGSGEGDAEMHSEDDDLHSRTSPEPEEMDEDEAMLEPLTKVVTEDVQEDVRQLNEEILKLVCQVGGGKKAYRRERKKAVRAIVAEIYSPPRVTRCAKMLPGLGILPGFALDLTEVNERGEPWDFDDENKQDEAIALIDEVKPLFLVGSPMCTAFSTWQRINAHRREPEKINAEYERAVKHLRFVCRVYRKQIDEGRYFLHEHPVAASSWQEPCIRSLMREENVDEVNMDQCQFGQKAVDGDSIKKPTKWISNSEEVLKVLGRRCQGRGGACSMAVCIGYVKESTRGGPLSIHSCYARPS